MTTNDAHSAPRSDGPLTIDAIRDAARRSAKTMTRPSRAFWTELLRAFMHPAEAATFDFDVMPESDLRALLVQTAAHEFGSGSDDAIRRWAAIFGIETRRPKEKA